MPKRLLTLWGCLVVAAAAVGFAAGQLVATPLPPAPTLVENRNPRVPVITLTRTSDGVTAAVDAAEARFVSGERTIVVLPGTSTSISLP